MFPRWFYWLFLVFLGYLIFLGTLPASAPRTVEEAAPPITEKTYPSLARFTNPDYWKRSLNPDYAAQVNCSVPEVSDGLALQQVEVQLGQGAPARCGEAMTVALTVWNAAGKPAYVAKELVLNLGAREVAAGLDAGLVGLRPGGERTLVLPPTALTRTKKSAAPKALLAALPAGKTAIITVRRLK